MRPDGKSGARALAIRLVKMAWCQIVFCQENLTGNDKSVDNRDTYLSFSNMAGGLNRLAQAGAVALTLGGAAEAQEMQSVNYELPASIDQVLVEFKACVEQATLLTDPAMIPDKAVRQVAFDALIENCNELQAADLRNIALDERIAAAQEAQAEAAATIAEENAKQKIAEAIIATENAKQAEIEAMTANLIAGAKAELGL